MNIPSSYLLTPYLSRYSTFSTYLTLHWITNKYRRHFVFNLLSLQKVKHCISGTEHIFEKKNGSCILFGIWDPTSGSAWFQRILIQHFTSIGISIHGSREPMPIRILTGLCVTPKVNFYIFALLYFKNVMNLGWKEWVLCRHKVFKKLAFLQAPLTFLGS